MELLIGKPSTRECLEKAIEGEIYEAKIMYPGFEAAAAHEGHIAVTEFQEQICESQEHAEAFAAILKKAEKRFKALKSVEERHANAYKAVLENL